MEKTNIITEILEVIKLFDGNYKREQVDAAIEHKEEITPHLIEILENALADPDPVNDPAGRDFHFLFPVANVVNDRVANVMGNPPAD